MSSNWEQLQRQADREDRAQRQEELRAQAERKKILGQIIDDEIERRRTPAERRGMPTRVTLSQAEKSLRRVRDRINEQVHVGLLRHVALGLEGRNYLFTDLVRTHDLDPLEARDVGTAARDLEVALELCRWREDALPVARGWSTCLEDYLMRVNSFLEVLKANSDPAVKTIPEIFGDRWNWMVKP